ncbi:biopolymer transporter ExbD [Marinobacterium sp. D7]|uniref:ExbD/TolR family protein n=1 Tax=Marinobacterium ramblicola TaxID=2849041 RepID=UPI001C2D1CEC|nr:biopolymer transporter ExbD [Marinobacterium ramblicola]MBV1789623.1 biopolymer transporter ExbD [Marinobacterium ramblicola]
MIIDTAKIKSRDNGDDNVIPLINIVFLMLIFFMVAGQVSKSDVVKTEPPKSINENRLSELESIDIIVTSEGETYIGDDLVKNGNISTSIKDKLKAYTDMDSVSVRLKVDADLPVAELRSLLRQVRDAGLVRVSLITRLSESAS